MAKQYKTWYLKDAPKEKQFRPWYLPGSEARKQQEQTFSDEDESFKDKAKLDQFGLVVCPRDSTESVDLASFNQAKAGSISLAEMYARQKESRAISLEEIMRPREGRPWFLPGSPQAEEYFQTVGHNEYPIGDPVGIEQREPTYLISKTPPWYHGLIDSSYIEIHTAQIGYDLPYQRSRIKIEFRNDNRVISKRAEVIVPSVDSYYAPITTVLLTEKMSSNEAIHFYTSKMNEANDSDRDIYFNAINSINGWFGWAFVINGANFDSQKQLEDENSSLLIKQFMSDNWRNFGLFFNDITITNEDGAQRRIPLRKIVVVLNGTIVFEKNYGEDLLYQQKLHLKNAIVKYRENLVSYSANKCPILKIAAEYLGQSYSPVFKGLWPQQVNYWAYKSRFWCSEFAAWAIYKATNGKFNPFVFDLQGKSLTMFDYFTDYYNPNDHRAIIVPADWTLKDQRKIYGTKWENLESSVKPGSYIKMNHGGHSGIFIKWTGRNLHTKRFLCIEGNGGNRVQISEKKVTNNINAFDTADLVWDKDADDNYDPENPDKEHEKGYYDGFGIVKHRDLS